VGNTWRVWDSVAEAHRYFAGPDWDRARRHRVGPVVRAVPAAPDV